SDFIKDLRSQWSKKFEPYPPFSFKVVAGDQDEFVPRESSIEPFDKNHRASVPGNHLQIVKPADRGALSVQLVLTELTGRNEVGVGSVAIAEELKESYDIVKQREPNKETLDGKAV